jgi:hypothetical protein
MKREFENSLLALTHKQYFSFIVIRGITEPEVCVAQQWEDLFLNLCETVKELELPWKNDNIWGSKYDLKENRFDG